MLPLAITTPAPFKTMAPVAMGIALLLADVIMPLTLAVIVLTITAVAQIPTQEDVLVMILVPTTMTALVITTKVVAAVVDGAVRCPPRLRFWQE